MKKVGGTTDTENTEELKNDDTEEQKPKKIRNRPLFHIKVSFIKVLSNFEVRSIKQEALAENTEIKLCQLFLCLSTQMT